MAEAGGLELLIKSHSSPTRPLHRLFPVLSMLATLGSAAAADSKANFVLCLVQGAQPKRSGEKYRKETGQKNAVV